MDDFSELTALEKSKTSTPLVIEQEHSSTDDEIPSADEKFDRMRYKSTLEKDDSRPLSSRNNVHDLYIIKEFLYNGPNILILSLCIEGFTHNFTAAEASGEEPLPSKSCIESLKENLKSFNCSAPSEQEFWRVEEQDMALKS